MELTHGRVALWLRPLVRREGPALLALHELGGSGADWEARLDAWSGPVYAIDFCGHGLSGALRGGSYYAELLAGDADAALAAVGPAALVGEGLGAYVALLLAGGRPDQVPAALLAPGRGLDGLGPAPDFDAPFDPTGDPSDEFAAPGLAREMRTDPRVEIIDQHFRPPDYTESFAKEASQLWFLEDGGARPVWWKEAAAIAGGRALNGDFESAFEQFAAERKASG